jgi:hypothetical protein
LAEGDFAIFAEGSTTSIANTVDTFAELPDRFNIVSKVGGKVYYSFDTIEKSKIKNIKQKDYVAEVANVWSTTITYCECVDGFQINLGIDEDSLIRRDGLTWTHRDFIVGVTAEEIDCQCANGVLSARDNNVVTKMAVDKIVAINSPYYTASSKLSAASLAGLTTYADNTARDAGETTPAAGDLVIVTAGTQLQVYDGSAWAVVGTNVGAITDLDTLVTALNTYNTDGSTANDIYIDLVISGKVQTAPNYNDLEVNYVYPRGVRLSPSIWVNEGAKAIAFVEDQALVYEIGSGYDLRAEEWDSMNYYTNLNYYPQLSDGIQAKNLVYQFENGVNYDTLTFEFYTDKVETNNGDKRLFGVLLGAVAGSQESADIEDIFTA